MEPSKPEMSATARRLHIQSQELRNAAHANGNTWSAENRAKYRKIRNASTHLARQARTKASSDFANKIMSLKSTSEFWSQIRRTMRSKPPKPAISASVIEGHFRKLLSPPKDANFDDDFLNYAAAVLAYYVPGPAVPVLDAPITAEEIKDAISRMKGSGPGEDGIGKGDLIAHDPEDIAFSLQVDESVAVPASLTRSLFIPIPKPGKTPNVPENLRGISL